MNLQNLQINIKNQPTLAFTHFQPAQPTTVGKESNFMAYGIEIRLR